MKNHDKDQNQFKDDLNYVELVNVSINVISQVISALALADQGFANQDDNCFNNKEQVERELFLKETINNF